MKLSNSLRWLLLLPFVLSSCSSENSHPFLSLHPVNPHYFMFRGRPEILIGSTEHYGAVMNLDFDYMKYLNEIASSGLNLTRTFSGIYVEPQGAFGIEKNTLAPAYGRYICPWARSKEPGYANGGNKFDLNKWDKDYFDRLKDFIIEAGKRNIVVELDLFSNFYDTIQWKLSPMYINNNINGLGNIKDHKEILSLKHPEMTEFQEKFVKKIVFELKDFDNLYFEICNEPYFGDTLALREWEAHMTGLVIEAEKDFKSKHLVSNNIANNFAIVTNERPGVSVYNFHYARPPVAVGMNYNLNKVLGDNETGFDGIDDVKYRSEAWRFILAGGGLFNNLDYSFAAGNEDGSFAVKKGQPGGGGKALRKQFNILTDFMEELDFINMKPLISKSLKSDEGENLEMRGLGSEDDLIGIYFIKKDSINRRIVFDVNLRGGSYSLSWVDTRNGNVIPGELKDQSAGFARITSPAFSEDIALRIDRLK